MAPPAHAAYFCFGKRATVVGTSGRDYLEGTEGPGNDQLDAEDGSSTPDYLYQGTNGTAGDYCRRQSDPDVLRECEHFFSW